MQKRLLVVKITLMKFKGFMVTLGGVWPGYEATYIHATLTVYIATDQMQQPLKL